MRMKEKSLTVTEQFLQEATHVDALLMQIKCKLLDAAPKIEVVYKVIGTPPKIEEWKVDKIGLSLPSKYMPKFWERPTINKRALRKDVSRIMEYCSFIQLVRDKFELSYLISSKREIGVSLSAVRYSELVKEDGECFYLRDKAEEECQKRQERYDKYYKPREGYTACAYCHKQVPNDSIMYKTIIGMGVERVLDSFRGRWINKRVVTKERLPFCSGECAYSEQCSREG